MDGVKILHAVSHGDWPRWLVIAVPATKPGDHPTGMGKAAGRMRVFLPFRAAFQCRAECVERFDLRLAEHG